VITTPYDDRLFARVKKIITADATEKNDLVFSKFLVRDREYSMVHSKAAR